MVLCGGCFGCCLADLVCGFSLPLWVWGDCGFWAIAFRVGLHNACFRRLVLGFGEFWV